MNRFSNIKNDVTLKVEEFQQEVQKWQHDNFCDFITLIESIGFKRDPDFYNIYTPITKYGLYSKNLDSIYTRSFSNMLYDVRFEYKERGDDTLLVLQIGCLRENYLNETLVPECYHFEHMIDIDDITEFRKKLFKSFYKEYNKYLRCIKIKKILK